MATTEQTKQEKINEIDQSLNLARVQLGEAKFVLGKGDTEQVKFLTNRTIIELNNILTKVEGL